MVSKDLMQQWLAATLAEGADVDARHEGMTLLMTAAAEGDAEAVETLLAHGANPHLRVGEPGPEEDYSDNDGRDLATGSTPLQLAARWGLEREEPNGGVSVLRLLLERGADIDEADARGDTPLDLAASHGSVEAVRLLLAHGAHVDAASHDGGTALLGAVASGTYEAALMLLDAGANVNAVNGNGYTALTVAVSAGDIGLVTLLLDRGADPDVRNRDGETPLTLAISREDAAIVKALQEWGADPDSAGVTR